MDIRRHSDTCRHSPDGWYRAIVVLKGVCNTYRVVRSQFFPDSEFGIQQCENFIQLHSTPNPSLVIATTSDYFKSGEVDDIPDQDYIDFALSSGSAGTTKAVNGVKFLKD